jgi:hypothetical protein
MLQAGDKSNHIEWSRFCEKGSQGIFTVLIYMSRHALHSSPETLFLLLKDL